ncbi:hypothetical protein DMENIID0001_040810 [Sergentomyia squamirostris]
MYIPPKAALNGHFSSASIESSLKNLENLPEGFIVPIKVFRTETVNLECEVDRVYKVDWYRNGVIISRRKKPSNHILTFSKNKLVLSTVGNNDSGIYECRTVTDDGGVTLKRYQLIVVDHGDYKETNLVAKKAPATNHYIGFNNENEGVAVKLDCSCDNCWPLTSYFWATPFGNFSNNDHEDLPDGWFLEIVHFHGDGFSLYLNIPIIRKKHTGAYTCVLENDLGKYENQRNVTVKVDEIVFRDAVTFEGYKVTLHCNNSHIGSHPSWEYTKYISGRHDLPHYPDNKVYRIFPALKNDSGLYTSTPLMKILLPLTTYRKWFPTNSGHTSQKETPSIAFIGDNTYSPHAKSAHK